MQLVLEYVLDSEKDMLVLVNLFFAAYAFAASIAIVSFRQISFCRGPFSEACHRQHLTHRALLHWNAGSTP